MRAVAFDDRAISTVCGLWDRLGSAGVGYQVASVVSGGFTPFIAVALVSLAGGSWHPVAAYLAVGCLISVLVAARMKTGRTAA